MIGPTGCQTAYQHSTFTQFSGGSYSSAWLMSGIVDPNGYGTSYSYDMQGRAISRAIQGVGVHTYLYQPGAILMVDPVGNITTQLTGSGFGLSALQNGLGAVTSYTRNANLARRRELADTARRHLDYQLQRRRVGFQRH